MLLKPEFLIFIFDGPETNSFIAVKKFHLISANRAKNDHWSCSC